METKPSFCELAEQWENHNKAWSREGRRGINNLEKFITAIDQRESNGTYTVHLGRVG